MRCRRIGKWSREIKREQVSDVGHSAKSSGSHCRVSIWRDGGRCSIWQVQTSDSERKRLVVDRLDRVNMQQIFTYAANLTRN